MVMKQPGPEIPARDRYEPPPYRPGEANFYPEQIHRFNDPNCTCPRCEADKDDAA